MDDEDGALTKACLWYNLFPNKRSCYFPTFYRVPVWFFLSMFPNSSSGSGTWFYAYCNGMVFMLYL